MGRFEFPHPTCHKVPLALVAKIVAFLDMTFGLFGLVWFVVMLAKYKIISLDPFDYLTAAGISADVVSKTGKSALLSTSTSIPLGIMMEPVEMEDTGPQNVTGGISQVPDLAIHDKVISLSLAGFYTGVNLIVFVLLLVGIYKKSPGRCMEWFHIRCAIFFFKLIILIMYLMGGKSVTHLYQHIPFVLSMLVHLYGIWVVGCFVNELKENRLREAIEKSRRQWEMARQNSDPPNGIQQVLQKRILDDQLKQHIFGF